MAVDGMNLLESIMDGWSVRGCMLRVIERDAPTSILPSWFLEYEIDPLNLSDNYNYLLDACAFYKAVIGLI